MMLLFSPCKRCPCPCSDAVLRSCEEALAGIILHRPPSLFFAWVRSGCPGLQGAGSPGRGRRRQGGSMGGARWGPGTREHVWPCRCWLRAIRERADEGGRELTPPIRACFDLIKALSCLFARRGSLMCSRGRALAHTRPRVVGSPGGPGELRRSYWPRSLCLLYPR